jgi:hypothetical protein
MVLLKYSIFPLLIYKKTVLLRTALFDVKVPKTNHYFCFPAPSSAFSVLCCFAGFADG